MPQTQSSQRLTGFSPLSERTFFYLTGSDRHRFLHSFCTANIKELTSGQVTEAFLLDGKGKTLWFGLVMALNDRLLMIGNGNFGPQLLSHLDKYIIREDVHLHDLSASTRQFFILGNDVDVSLKPILESLLINFHGDKTERSDQPIEDSPVECPGMNCVCEWLDSQLIVANAEIAGPGFLLVVAESLAEPVGHALSAAFDQVATAELERLRIEHITPWYGTDLNESNLPQELNRDDKAISFTKGCYLGQETVARIDALGHVNQMLVRLKITNQALAEVGKELFHEGKLVGKITSVAACDSHWIALGLVKRQLAISGTRLADGDICVL